MIGAFIGDMSGSRFEFNNIRSTDFELIHKDCTFTDDSVLTIALMDWVLHEEDKNMNTAALYLYKWAIKYPYAGYGNRFFHWLEKASRGIIEPYGSCGNGSAMRISGVATAYSKDKELLKVMVDYATECTHNHIEGMKGATVVATCISMGINKCSKEEIKEYALKEYPEIKDFDYETLRRTYKFDETCQKSVPQAIYCFLISNDFEDCLRKTISIGGDCDTTAAISCSIAEAYYQSIPSSIIEAVRKKLPPEFIDIIDEFNEKYGY